MAKRQANKKRKVGAATPLESTTQSGEEDDTADAVSGMTATDVGPSTEQDSVDKAIENGLNDHQKSDRESGQSDPSIGGNVDEFQRTTDGDKQSADGSEWDEEDEEEILVVLELADFKNHPILDDYKSITIEGIDTAKPTLHIGEYSLYGQLEETVGTHFFYDTKNRTDENEYRYAGQTTKKIKFTIAAPDEL